MPKKIPKEMIPLITKTAPRTEYDWERYTDGEWWEFKKGDDYQVHTQSARGSAKRWADREGYGVEFGSLKEADGFVVRFIQ